MARYKGRASTKTNERDFPHHIDMRVPEGGLGKRLDAMHDWHAARGIQARDGRGYRQGERDYIRWCFADPATAEAFKAQFGGIEPMPKDDPLALMEWAKRNIQSD